MDTTIPQEQKVEKMIEWYEAGEKMKLGECVGVV